MFVAALLLTASLAAAAEPAATRPISENRLSAGEWSWLAGEWGSSFGKVQMSVEGKLIKGTYQYAGAWVKGTFEGTIDERGTLRVESWQETMGYAERGPIKRGKSGKAILKVTKPTQIKGTWGYGGSRTNGGEWKLFRPITP